MSALRPLDGIDLKPQAMPPRKTRILAPSGVEVDDTGGYSPQCACSLRIVDPVNLHIYYVPLTPQVVTQLRSKLAQHDPMTKPVPTNEDTTK